jgi:hypothetical protein
MADRTLKSGEYPRCPRCGDAVAAAMMTSRSVGYANEIYYAPAALSAYCVSVDCNYDAPLATLTTPVPARQCKRRARRG